ncbi:ABC transporter substrate-binding protein [Afipia sp. GAS231]|uniref:ABC transporter substrate-binding protein n=1 Tax=Afipia sp. GAS231 TaxID=1882747 RepID=UPI0015615D3B|nr:extracellular solute-binding protein [Afipia sp. GAS231]
MTQDSYISRRGLLAGATAAGAVLGTGSRSLAQANADWQTGAPAEWDRVLAAARSEGLVTVAGFPLLSEKMSAAFKRDTGIQLNFLGGNTAEQSARLEAEARAKNVTIDVLVSGARELVMMKEDLLEPILPQLILPGVAPKNFRDGKHKFVDNAGQYLLQGASYVFGWLTVNTDVVKPGEIKVWKDLLDPKYRGKIAAYDFRFPGPGQGPAIFLYNTRGPEFIKELFHGQQVKFSTENRSLMEGVVRGTTPILLGGIQLEVERFRANFKNIGVVLPEDGPGYLTGGFSVIKQAKGVPHPNAAKVFINWYMSKPGQELYESITLEASRRIDLGTSPPSYVVPGKFEYTDDYTEDYYLLSRSSMVKSLNDTLGQR